MKYFGVLPKAIAIDLDGTLLNSKTQLSPRSYKAVLKCAGAGIPVIIATSRPARFVNRLIPRDLAVLCSYVLQNGAIALGNFPLSGSYKEELPEFVIRDIIKKASSFSSDTRVTIEIDGYAFGANWKADADALWERNSATPDMVLSIEDAIAKGPSKLAIGGLGTDILKMVDDLRKDYNDIISIVPGLLGNPLLNITSSNATKPRTIQRILESNNISLSEVIAFGDDIPDIDMLRECGIAVAVSNALPEVKAVCGYHTLSNDEDGVAIVLEEMFLADANGNR